MKKFFKLSVNSYMLCSSGNIGLSYNLATGKLTRFGTFTKEVEIPINEEHKKMIVELEKSLIGE